MLNRITLVVLSVAVAATLADNPYHQPQYQEQPANYQFSYEVRDEYSGNEFGQEEARSGYNTDGKYSVLLPDGRKQIVTYKVLDAESGYIADIKYEGEAQEPAYQPRSYEPAPKPHYAPATAQRAYAPAPYTAHATRAPYVAPATYAPTPAPYKAPRQYPTHAPYVAPTHAPYKAPVTYATRAPYVAPATYAPAPYKARATYRPTPAPYKPTPAPYKAPVTYGPSYAPASAPSYHANSVKDIPTYNSALLKKRKMKYPKKLSGSASSHSDGALFYGSVNGKLRKPARI